MTWKMLHPRADPMMLGYLPEMLREDDPRTAREQFNDNYSRGGGWVPFHGHTFNRTMLVLTYPGDPPMHAIAETKLRDERIIMFECAWVIIIQPDGAYEIARMD